MRANISIVADVDAEDSDIRDAVQAFVDQVDADLSGEDITATITVLEDTEIEITPSPY